MRKMKNVKTGQVLNITKHVILQNFWEYYFTDDDTGVPDVEQAFVMGFENELGDVYLPEIKPYIITQTTNLDEVMPAQGFQWV